MPVATDIHTPAPIDPTILSAPSCQPDDVAAVLREVCEGSLAAVRALADLAEAVNGHLRNLADGEFATASYDDLVWAEALPRNDISKPDIDGLLSTALAASDDEPQVGFFAKMRSAVRAVAYRLE